MSKTPFEMLLEEATIQQETGILSINYMRLLQLFEIDKKQRNTEAKPILHLQKVGTLSEHEILKLKQALEGFKAYHVLVTTNAKEDKVEILEPQPKPTTEQDLRKVVFVLDTFYDEKTLINFVNSVEWSERPEVTCYNNKTIVAGWYYPKPEQEETQEGGNDEELL